MGTGRDLADKPLGAERGSEFGTEDLYGDLALVLQILGEIDRRHATGTKFALDGVAVGEGGGEAVLSTLAKSAAKRIIPTTGNRVIRAFSFFA